MTCSVNKKAAIEMKKQFKEALGSSALRTDRERMGTDMRAGRRVVDKKEGDWRKLGWEN